MQNLSSNSSSEPSDSVPQLTCERGSTRTNCVGSNSEVNSNTSQHGDSVSSIPTTRTKAQQPTSTLSMASATAGPSTEDVIQVPEAVTVRGDSEFFNIESFLNKSVKYLIASACKKSRQISFCHCHCQCSVKFASKIETDTPSGSDIARVFSLHVRDVYGKIEYKRVIAAGFNLQ